MKKPIIGILTDSFMTEVGRFKSKEREFVNTDYIESILFHGGIPILIPLCSIREDVEAALQMCDGLLFPGGDDVDPDFYGEEPIPGIGLFRPENDEAAFLAAAYAKEHRLPMLGICRGIQVLNVFMGGTLYQDLEKQKQEPLIQHMQSFDGAYLTHYIDIEPDSRLAKLLQITSCRVNTVHHQAVKDVGAGLKVTARSRDGIIEAIEDETGLIMAVQWHPERLLTSSLPMKNLFIDLIERSASRNK